MHELIIPNISGTDTDTAVVKEIHAREGDAVHKGDILFVIETTKAVVEIESEFSGTVLRLFVKEGDTVVVPCTAGITGEKGEDASAFHAPSQVDTAGEKKTLKAAWVETVSKAAPARKDAGRVAATPRARRIAESYGLDISHVHGTGKDGLVTEKDVILHHEGKAPAGTVKRVVVVGADIMGRLAVELIGAVGGYELAGFVDDNPELSGKTVMGVPVIGGVDRVGELAKEGPVAAVVCIGKPALKKKVAEKVESLGAGLASLVHPRAYVSPYAKLAPGTVVEAGAVIHTGASIGKGSMLWPNATVNHDCAIGDYCFLAPSCCVGGFTKVGDGVVVGMGAVLAPDIVIGENSIIGMGAVVMESIPPDSIVAAEKARITGKRKLP